MNVLETDEQPWDKVKEALDIVKAVPYRNPPTEKISRAEAQKRAEQIFGPRAFARKTTKTNAPFRCEIGIRKTVAPFQVVVYGVGETWRKATEDAITNIERGQNYDRLFGRRVRVVRNSLVTRTFEAGES